MKMIKKNVTEKKDQNKMDKRPNWILRITLLVIAVPIIVLAVVLLTSMEKSGSPVVGSRFNKHLDPAISKDQVKEIESVLTFNNVQNVEVNLKSATLRISIDMNDDVNQETVSTLTDEVYKKVTEILPADTYFTNKLTADSTIKMYDLEINVYNYIPDETNRDGWIKCVLHKNATEEELSKDWPSIARDAEVAEEVKNQVSGETKVE